MSDSDLPSRVSTHFHNQADACDQLGSPFTARLCRVLAKVLDDQSAVGRKVLGWAGDPRADALALRLCGGLHALVLSGADAELARIYPPEKTGDRDLALALPAALARNEAHLLAMLESPPQTNEIARSGMLLPGFLAIARESGLALELTEIGASAGLNLLFDRFHYRYGKNEWGNAGSPVRLAPEVRGQAPSMSGDLQIVDRAGCDLAPIRISDPAQRLRLRAYVWADQTLRLERLDAAISLAEREPPTLVKLGAAEFVEQRLSARSPDRAFVLFHSIMWQYMPPATRARIVELLETQGSAVNAGSPLYWLRMEPLAAGDPYATLSLTSWPGGTTRALARCDYHGRWMEWL
ncbi:DUF2332 family protein [Aminobacter sp. AP02]|uniref:DUF2332 domain-containing protein n=1 Tax=Aminobacter sp. AP02 TaxID=2135737 RepID=UPI000D6C2BA8|nr:DUF2332 family protein [Aminobacter sp. AP02]PWK76158.1 hypothetical protein C8K44_102145 [Aminobacter sp. AP02]